MEREDLFEGRQCNTSSRNAWVSVLCYRIPVLLFAAIVVASTIIELLETLHEIRSNRSDNFDVFVLFHCHQQLIEMCLNGWNHFSRFKWANLQHNVLPYLLLTLMKIEILILNVQTFVYLSKPRLHNDRIRLLSYTGDCNNKHLSHICDFLNEI